MVNKKACGELYGHEGAITTLVFSPGARLNDPLQQHYLLSGAEDGTIIIWRLSDMVSLHHLTVKNIQKVVSLSMHPSGRMLLALYGNGMLRLWNLLDARCIFKKMCGLVEDSEESEEEEEEAVAEGEEKVEKVKIVKDPKKLSITDKYQNQPELARWEPKKGEMYCVVFSKLVEIYSVADDSPMH